jgi:Ni,Fe-hydrogenase I small subunit
VEDCNINGFNNGRSFVTAEGHRCCSCRGPSQKAEIIENRESKVKIGGEPKMGKGAELEGATAKILVTITCCTALGPLGDGLRHMAYVILIERIFCQLYQNLIGCT